MPADSLRVELPRDLFIRELGKRLISRRGPEGISDLVDRLSAPWDKLQRIWLEPERDNRALGRAVRNAAARADAVDLVTTEIRLRHTGAAGDGQDVAVCANIARALFEVLCAGNAETVYQTALDCAAVAPVENWNDTGWLLNLVLAKLHVERGKPDLAAEAAKRNLDLFICPTSQYALYQALVAKAKTGSPATGFEITVDDLSDRFCSEPFNTLATGTGRLGGAPSFFACSCPGTVPYPLAPAELDGGRDRLWNGEEIQEIRRSILDGDFTYCSRKVCPYIVHNTLPKRAEITDKRLKDIIDNHRTVLETPPVQVTLGHDPSCNLACPSCRTELITIKNDARAVFDETSEKILLPLLADGSMSLILSTDGDPFASKHYRKLLHGLDADRHAGLKIALITNGLLLTNGEWDSLGHVQKLIHSVGVSIDGARPETYENLRRPGKWSVINKNMEFLGELRRQNKLAHLNLQFVVQRENFEEMIEYVELGKRWSVDLIRFIRLVNIGSYSPETFEDNDVCDSRHPLFPRLFEILKDPVFEDPIVDMFTLSPLHQMALRTRPPKRGIVASLKRSIREWARA